MRTEQEIFSEIIDILENNDIPYMIGGSVASIAYGEPRMTLDMDVVVDMDITQVKKFVDSLKSDYYADINTIIDAINNKGHFNVIQSEMGVKIDFYILKNSPFDQEGFEGRHQEAFDNKRQASFATPEYIILKKLEWFKMGESQKHLNDIKGILKISGNKLNLLYIDEWAFRIGVSDIWQKIKKEHGKE